MSSTAFIRLDFAMSGTRNIAVTCKQDDDERQGNIIC